MKLKKRWGKKYIDNRNWKKYNGELIFRGEVLINPVFLKSWNKEVRQMNAGKIGQPYLYPESMIEFLAVLHCRGIDFRGLQGFMKGLSDNFKYQFPVIVYSQICRRFNKMKVNFGVLPEDTNDYLIAGSDGTGEKSSKRGGWIREVWKIRKGWIKVVITGVKNKKGKKYVIDIRVGNENLNEKESTRGMIKDKQKNIGILYADGLHDCKDTFNLCDKYGIATGIKIREGSSIKTRKSARRREEVKIYQGMPYEEWAREKKYGTRWVVTEGIFSACKRIYGEYVSATKTKNMYHEAKVKFWAYNKLVNLKN